MSLGNRERARGGNEIMNKLIRKSDAWITDRKFMHPNDCFRQVKENMDLRMTYDQVIWVKLTWNN